MAQSVWKEFIVSSKKERRAVFLMLLIVSFIISLPLLFPAKKLELSINESLQKQLDEYQQQHPEHNYNNKFSNNSAPQADTSYQTKATGTLFQFDPNTLNEDGFNQLGLNNKVIHTLINYRNKGGYFKSPQDIKKIYGLSPADANRLIPYIQISSTAKNKNYDYEDKQPPVKQLTSNETYHTININTATADEWKSLPGIGEVLGNRIVKFRNATGGFNTVDDVKKTYGLSDSTFNLIRPYLILK